MDIEFEKLSLNHNCELCKKNNNNKCDDCSRKIKFLYDGIDVRCIYCQFFIDFNTSYICNNCKN